MTFFMRAPANIVPALLATAAYGSSSLLLAQASGGNNSVKNAGGDLMWIKASGARLADVSETSGTVTIRCGALRDAIRQEKGLQNLNRAERRTRHEDSVKLANAALVNETPGRASLEVGFHALLGDVVLHLHPVYLNAFTCMENGHGFLSHVAPHSFGWVEYATPGYELAVKVNQAISETENSTRQLCLVLENHGFIASGQTAREVVADTEDFISAARTFLGELSPDLITAKPPILEVERAAQMLLSLVSERWGRRWHIVRPAYFGAFEILAKEPRLLEVPGALVPDDVVYAGAGIHCCSTNKLRDLVGNLPEAPEKLAVAIEGIGTILLARNESLARAMEETLLAHVLVRILVARRGKIKVLQTEEIEYLQSMESEKYRIEASAERAG